MRHWRGPFDRQGYHHGNLKEALIEAAQRFIAERGIGGFTLADAAKLVGVTPAALYRHFRGREALVAEVAFRGFDELAKRLGKALQSDGTALERFTQSLAKEVAPDGIRVNNVAPDVVPAVTPNARTLNAARTRLLESARARGLVSDGDLAVAERVTQGTAGEEPDHEREQHHVCGGQQ